MNKETIKQLVEKHFDLKIDTQCRRREYVEARAIYFKLTRDNTRLSLQAIGLGVGRHYASVLHNIQQLNTWMEYDVTLRNHYTTLNNRLKNLVTEVDEVIEMGESIAAKYIELKEEVLAQRKTIERMAKEYAKLESKYKALDKYYA